MATAPNTAWYFEQANTERFQTITGMRTGREYRVREFIYGTLVPDHGHPLSAVSVSNNSLSIDLWTGCAWQCRYCYVHGTRLDLNEAGRTFTTPRRRTPFTVDEIVDALLQHPFFQPDVTVLSLHTASTEPFSDGPVTASTFAVMEAFLRRGLRNPFWIVTKAHVPLERLEAIARIAQSARGLMISICWADNPEHIEPVQNDRFLHAREARAAGATISWYLRPLVREWSGAPERIARMMGWVRERYGDAIDMIVPGGLRWTEGIEYGLSEVYGLPMPDVPRDDNVKTMAPALWEAVVRCGGEFFPGVPIYRHSACGLTRMLRTSSLTAVQTRCPEDCEASICPEEQRQLCASGGIHRMDRAGAQEILDRLGVPARVVRFDPRAGLVTEPSLSHFAYGIRRTILKQLALGKAEAEDGDASSDPSVS